MATQDLGQYLDPVRENGVRLNSNEPLVVAGSATFTGTASFATTSQTGNQTVTGNSIVTGNESISGTSTVTGGVIGPGTAPTVFHSGNVGMVATTGLNQTQIVTTDTYYAEVFIPENTTLTGISVLNGHTTSAGVSLTVGLANSSGVIVANSATTTAQGAADAYQQIPFTTTYAAVGPAKYYIAVQGSATTGFLAMHKIGNFGANLKTSETYGTFVTTASYSTTTFTTNTGPVADTY